MDIDDYDYSTNTYYDSSNNTCIVNPNKYEIVSYENNNILLRNNNNYVTNINELKNFDFINSKIKSCKINTCSFKTLNYKNILSYIYNLIKVTPSIIKNSILNIDIKPNNSTNYYLSMDNLLLYIHYSNNNKYIYEIINQSVNNNITIEMKILLIDNTIINLLF